MAPEDWLRGLLTVDRAGTGRLPELVRDRVPGDTWDASLVPAGVRLEFRAGPGTIELGIAASILGSRAARRDMHRLSVWADGRHHSNIELSEGNSRVVIPTEQSGRYVVHLPEGMAVRIDDIGADHELRPVPDEPVWLAYGDSITQGWSASDQGLNYPAIVARRLGLDWVNLGFAASARGEIAIAEQMAVHRADIISVAFGTNNWVKTPTGPAHLRGIMDDFITVLRAGHPQVPIVVISPVVRPDAEANPNVLGATLTDLRAAIEDVVRDRAATDRHLALIAGRPLIEERELADSVHPDDRGHAAIARKLIPALTSALAEPAAATGR